MRSEKIIEGLKTIKTMSDVPEFLIKNELNNNLCELGVWNGGGIENFIRCNPKLLIGVDCWDQTDDPKTSDGIDKNIVKGYYENCLKLMIKYPQVKYIKSLTNDYVGIFEDGFFDFVYVDACHAYETCKEDLNNWFAKVKSGGILAGHDYFQHTSSYKFGVVEAVDEFVEENKSKLYAFYVTPESSSPSYFMYKK